MDTYYQRNKETLKQKAKERYERDKEQILLKKKDYYKKNQEAIKKCKNEYYRCPEKHKNIKISDWKQKGIISDNFDELYDKYINTTECELCNCELTTGSGIIGKKHLDHCHETGLFRNILCGSCNINLNKKN